MCQVLLHHQRVERCRRARVPISGDAIDYQTTKGTAMPRSTETTTAGKPIGTATKSDGTKKHFVVERVVEVMEGDFKRIVFQLLRLSGGRFQYRIGYYVLGTKNEWKDKWIWARSTPLVNPEHLAALLAQATRQGWYPSPSEA